MLLAAFWHRRAQGRTSCRYLPWKSVGRNRNVGQMVEKMTFLQEGKGGKAELMAVAQELLMESVGRAWESGSSVLGTNAGAG